MNMPTRGRTEPGDILCQRFNSVRILFRLPTGVLAIVRDVGGMVLDVFPVL